jgi:hypothetical protein
MTAPCNKWPAPDMGPAFDPPRHTRLARKSVAERAQIRVTDESENATISAF